MSVDLLEEIQLLLPFNPSITLKDLCIETRADGFGPSFYIICREKFLNTEVAPFV